jgi:putative permease
MIAFWMNFYKRFLSRPEAGMLLSFFVLGILFLTLASKILAPLLVSIVIAYLLDWAVAFLQKYKCPQKLAALLVFVFFLAIVILFFVLVIPLLSKQISNLTNEIPTFVNRLQFVLDRIPQYIPFLTGSQIENLLDATRDKIMHFGQIMVETTLMYLPNIVALVVYLVMVPLLIYFFLLDKKQLLSWFNKHFIPEHQDVLEKIWAEVHSQIGNYIRGKVLEMIIVTIVTYIAFILFGLKYSLLLSICVGISVFIPYIGAIVVTIPIILVGLFQWGWTSTFVYLMIVYAVITALDGNVLVPLLFSEAVSLHPVAIIIAVLMFGGIWGFWGIFFAIPLAALVKAVMTHWPLTRKSLI